MGEEAIKGCKEETFFFFFEYCSGHLLVLNQTNLPWFQPTQSFIAGRSVIITDSLGTLCHSRQGHIVFW